MLNQTEMIFQGYVFPGTTLIEAKNERLYINEKS